MWSVSISYGSGSETTGDDGQFLLAGLTGQLILGFGIFALVLLGAVFLIGIVMCIDCMRKREKVNFQDDLEEDPSEDITKEEIIKEHDSEEDGDEGDELDTVSVESSKEEITEITPEEEVERNDNEAAAVMAESEEQEEPEPEEPAAEDTTPHVLEPQEDIPTEDNLEVTPLKEESADVNDNEDEEKTTIQEILETPLEEDQDGQEGGDKLNSIPPSQS